MGKGSESDKALDIRQSPIGFYNLGLSYISAADELAKRHLNSQEPFRLAFEGPIKHLYAHGWELCLKACIFQQGTLPSDMKRRLGHQLADAWAMVDKDRFRELRLIPETLHFLKLLDDFHPTKLYAYPVTGARKEYSLTYLRAASQRFHLDRATIGRLFGTSIHDLG